MPERRAKAIFTEEDIDRVGVRYVEELQYRFLQALIAAIEDEREACARIAEHAEHAEYGAIAEEIRARARL